MSENKENLDKEKPKVGEEEPKIEEKNDKEKENWGFVTIICPYELRISVVQV